MIKVGVIRGGVSSQYDTSLATGGHVLSVLRDEQFKDTYKALDMLIDKEGILHMNGRPIQTEDIYKNVDVVFNALHGDFGQDGKLQQILDHWSIPYTGSGIFPSALAHNRKLTKYKFKSLGIRTPEYMIFPEYHPDFDGDESDYGARKAREVWNKMPAPWIVKPVIQTGSMGNHVCKTFPELVRAFEEASRKGVSVMVEELIVGREASVIVADKFREKDLYTFPVIELRGVDTICPGAFSQNQKMELESLARTIHKEFNLDHYSKSNFMIHPKKGVYIYSVDTLPHIAHDSHISHALKSVGATFHEFIDHILKLAIKKK
jgi:D-alanine-D-alanine ligase